MSDELVPFVPTLENINAEFRAWKAGEDAVLALALENKKLKGHIEELEGELLISEEEELALEAELLACEQDFDDLNDMVNGYGR